MHVSSLGAGNLADAPVLKTFTRGTHRTIAPEETLARYRQLASSMGITRLGNVTGLDCIGIPVAIAVRPNSRSISVAQGKGLTLPHALASALMEAIETFHAEDLDGRFRTARARDLASEACVANYAQLCGTGQPLAPDEPVPWIEGVDVLSGQPCWVPAEAIHLDMRRPSKPGSGHFHVGSNGLASGNHLLEALSSAICELVERDAAAVWDARTPMRRGALRLDLGTVDDVDCRRLLDAYEDGGMRVSVWNATSDIGIAAFTCDISSRLEDASVGLPRFRGAGCHPSRGIALGRALAEAAQVRLTHIAGIRDDLPPSAYKKRHPEQFGAALLDYRSSQAEPCSFGAIPSFDTEDLVAEVQWELDQLRRVGAEQVIAVDLTRPDFAVPVVKVVIPGLEGNPGHPHYSHGPRARAAHAGTA